MELVLVGLACFCLGLTTGWMWHNFAVCEPLRNEVGELTGHIVRMRKQGFVPQFEIEQKREHDPSREIPEF